MKHAILFTLLMAVAAFPQQQPKFEVAAVYPSKTAPGFVDNRGGIVRDGRYINRDATLLDLIEAAYGVSEDAISGGPGWVGLDAFDIVAKSPEGTTAATANLMLRDLLADRFGLVIQQGIRPLPRYVLTVAKSGSKLKTAGGSDDTGCKRILSTGSVLPGDPSTIPNARIACHNLSSAGIGEALKSWDGYLDHDVIDSTGLDGTYDFGLEWTDMRALALKGADGISLSTAVEKQLGLKLDVKNVDVPSLVIAKVNRRPSANPAGIETSLAIPAPRFEVASIKLADPGRRPFRGVDYSGGTQMHAGGTLRLLISIALQIAPNIAADTVVNLPKSADEEQWDIIAKMPVTGEGSPQIVHGQRQSPPFSILTEMLRGLLVERFEMKTHPETREVTVYALTLTGSKSKMRRADDSERAGCPVDNKAPKPALNVSIVYGCKNTSMDELAGYLTRRASMDHPVVDTTDLEGGWDFTIGWTPENLLRTPPAPGGATPPIGDTAAPNGISVFEAVEQQLGLKLVKQRRTIPVIVVDHVDGKPLE
jgi:uncharacterized protein (TIGR03435 family)